mmetsp:Transcript_10877/g.40268  ORF Transcript_10877/g.40268 Transcript_10877/m.40268 type:complete len:241 (-) Transcript_10877:92-814(-)
MSWYGSDPIFAKAWRNASASKAAPEKAPSRAAVLLAPAGLTACAKLSRALSTPVNTSTFSRIFLPFSDASLNLCFALSFSSDARSDASLSLCFVFSLSALNILLSTGQVTEEEDHLFDAASTSSNLFNIFSVNSRNAGSSHAASKACSARAVLSMRATVLTSLSSLRHSLISSLEATASRCFRRSLAPSSSSASSSNERFGRGGGASVAADGSSFGGFSSGSFFDAQDFSLCSRQQATEQ